ncbi:MAG: hypothetical protein ABI889_01340 [Gemmatimonadota bacterium]
MTGMSVFLLARFLHVVAGVAWAGAVILIGFFITPAVRAVGPAGGAVLQQLVRVQRMSLYLMIMMAFTILSGFALYWLDIKAFGPAWIHTGPGRTFSAGAAFAIITAVVGMVVNLPTAKKLGAIMGSVQASGKPPSAEQGAELGRLQNRLLRMGQLSAVLTLLAVTCMGVARYIP